MERRAFQFVLLCLLAIGVAMTSGCATATGKRAQEYIISGVKTYCQQPQPARLVVREAVNEGLHGEAEVKVVCKGDPE